MSEFNGASLNALPSPPPAKAAQAGPKSGQPLPAQVVEGGETARRKLETASFYEKLETKESREARETERSDEQDSIAQQVEEAVARLNDYVQQTERKLNFQVDDESGMTIIRVYEKQSEELIRQIPSEEVVSLAQKLNQEEPLMLFSAQV